MDFFHWVLVDIPADAVGIQEGEFSEGVTARGKGGPAAARGTRQGVNDFSAWFAGDEAMAGSYFGYWPIAAIRCSATRRARAVPRISSIS